METSAHQIFYRKVVFVLENIYPNQTSTEEDYQSLIENELERKKKNYCCILLYFQERERKASFCIERQCLHFNSNYIEK